MIIHMQNIHYYFVGSVDFSIVEDLPAFIVDSKSLQQKLMIAEKDEQIQALLSQRAFKAPNLLCGSSHRIERFCSNSQCKYDSLCCIEEQCKHCEVLHRECPFFMLRILNKAVEERVFLENKFLRNLFNIENDLITRLIATRKQTIDNYKELRIGDSSKTIQSIYFENTILGLKGRDMRKLFSQLTEKKSNFQKQCEEYLQSYRIQGGELVHKAETLRKHLIGRLGSSGEQPTKHRKKQEQFKKEQSKAENRLQIVSKILAEDIQGQQKYQFLLKQLNNPKQLKLLYRASQHNFSAAKFHQYCDGINNTVTIVRTEFGKTIAAYTPLKWNSPVHADFFTDYQSGSFLLQLETKQKMSLSQPQYAIWNNEKDGPTFGGGHDLFIADKCNQNKKNYSNFPSSYNFQGKYQRNQQATTMFCGNPNGHNFRVIEYEVFIK